MSSECSLHTSSKSLSSVESIRISFFFLSSGVISSPPLLALTTTSIFCAYSCSYIFIQIILQINTLLSLKPLHLSFRTQFQHLTYAHPPRLHQVDALHHFNILAFQEIATTLYAYDAPTKAKIADLSLL